MLGQPAPESTTSGVLVKSWSATPSALRGRPSRPVREIRGQGPRQTKAFVPNIPVSNIQSVGNIRVRNTGIFQYEIFRQKRYTSMKYSASRDIPV